MAVSEKKVRGGELSLNSEERQRYING